LLKTTLCGLLLGDTAYQPSPSARKELAQKGLQVLVSTDPRWHFQNPLEVAAWIDAYRHLLDRQFSLFNQHFHGDRTLCRSPRHHYARRWCKVLAFNLSRFLNRTHGWPTESMVHFHMAA